jgi:predicted Zn-dependent protease
VQLEEAVKLSGGRDPLTLHLLGRVYADLGRAPQAVEAERQALALATEQKNAALVQLISAHLAGLLR